MRTFPASKWPDLHLLDPMCGGGALAIYAKAQGLAVSAADAAERAALVARALIANSTVQLSRPVVTAFLAAVAEAKPAGPVPAPVRARLAAAPARWFTAAVQVADTYPEPRRSLLRLVITKLFLRQFPLSLPAASDAPAAAAGDFDRLSPRRLGHYLQRRQGPTPAVVWHTAAVVNTGVIPGYGAAARADAITMITATEADVLVLDPPYPQTMEYADAYAPLDALLGAAPVPEPPTLDDLLDAGRRAPWLLLTYGGPTAALDDVVARVERHRTVVTARAVPYRHLAAIASETKNATNTELLLIARR